MQSATQQDLFISYKELDGFFEEYEEQYDALDKLTGTEESEKEEKTLTPEEEVEIAATEKRLKSLGRQICASFKQLHFSDQGYYISNLRYKERELFLPIVKSHIDPLSFREIDAAAKAHIYDILGAQFIAGALGELEIDESTSFLADFSNELRIEILRKVPAKLRNKLKITLSYPDNSAGRLMDTNLVVVDESATVEEVFSHLRANKDFLPEKLFDIYITTGKIVTKKIALSELATLDPQVKLQDLPDIEECHIINAYCDRQEIINTFLDYQLLSLAVSTDTDGTKDRIIGVITIDNLGQITREKAEYDILHMAGVTEKSADLNTGIFSTSRVRIFWLFINLLTAILASTVVSIFEDGFKVVTALAVLMPIVASMGGNAGVQVSTVTVRMMAVEDLDKDNFWRFFNKEFAVATLNGLFFSLLSTAIVYLYTKDVKISLIFASAMLITILFAGLFGVLMPVMVKKLKGDPAVISGVFITTVTDVVGFLSFLGLASILLIK